MSHGSVGTVDIAVAVENSAPKTIAWLSFVEGNETHRSGEKTPLWIDMGHSSGEHTPTEYKLLNTGWM